MNRWICIHGHFYQPPRENPWLEEIEIQDSAYPYHDWNERISAECYEPNAFSRILDEEKRIVNIINNYSRISFDFGPTLLSWLEQKDPVVYRAVLEADRQSQEKFSGHGSALAQAYNHMIMPLANSRDKRTQIQWGIKDFKHRFKRDPEGMWLPETAVDKETLEIMAELGIKFVILAPHQVKSEKPISPQKPYRCPLPSGRSIAVFFYDGPISHDVAFGGLLKNGEAFANRLLKAFPEKEDLSNPLVHIATDGETFGHHNRFGDMALSYCLHYLESRNLARITVYGEYLEQNPPEEEVEILENSSWSCVHGVERWRSNCGCSTGKHPGWNQEWRAPLREAMDKLRDRMSALFQNEMSANTNDPWEVRDQYIEVILDRSPAQVKDFLSSHSRKELHPDDQVRMLKLLEMQRNALLMYTSCGWFFDDISGIETVQVIQYAARALQMAQDISGEDYESAFLKDLEKAPSNIPQNENGARVYEKFIKPAVLDLLRVGAHYAISSLFEDYKEKTRINCYLAERESYHLDEAGKQKLAVGRVKLRSDIVWEEDRIGFMVLHLGDHNVVGGVRKYQGEKGFKEMMESVRDQFSRSDITGVINQMDDFFKGHNYSLWHLFRDKKREVMNRILEGTLDEIERTFRQIYENHYPTIQAMKEMKIPLPSALATPIEVILNKDFRDILSKESPDIEKLKKLADEFKRWSFTLNEAALSLLAKQRLNQFMGEVLRSPQDVNLLKTVESLFQLLNRLGIKPDLWESQNVYFRLTKGHFPEMENKARQGNQQAQDWVDCFRKIGAFLGVKSP
jgi:alpha-amylase/alpha-mannosidase (GH57 family)